MAEKSKILVIGGTGYIGKFIVEASAKLGNPTFALVRNETISNSDKAPIIDNFKKLGVNLVTVCHFSIFFANCHTFLRNEQYFLELCFFNINYEFKLNIVISRKCV